MSQAIYYVNDYTKADIYDAIYQLNPTKSDQIDQKAFCHLTHLSSKLSPIDIQKSSLQTSTVRIPSQAIDIPIRDVVNKDTLLTSLAKACNFAPYFAHNWDSAFDCLTDSTIRYLKLDLTNVDSINTQDFDTFKRLIEDAYADFGKPQLWVIGVSFESH